MVEFMKFLHYPVKLLSVEILSTELVNTWIDWRQIQIYPVVSVAATLDVQALGHRRDFVEVDCANAFLVFIRIIVVADFRQNLFEPFLRAIEAQAVN